MYININIETGIFVLIVGHLFTGLMGIAYRAQNRKESILYMYLLSRFFEMTAWILIGLRGALPFSISVVLGNAALLIGTGCQIAAILKVNGKFTHRIRIMNDAATLISIVILTFVSYRGYSEGVRVATLSLILTLLWIYPIWTLISYQKASTLQKMLAIVYAFSIVPHAVRAIRGFVYGYYVGFMHSNIENAISFAALYIVMLVGNMGILLLSKEKNDAKIYHAAMYDELTLVYNRRMFFQVSNEILDVCARKKKCVSVLLMDVDHFKAINDTYGHYAGDEVLRNFVAVIDSKVKTEDIVGRIGGEEFMVLLTETDQCKVVEIAESIRLAIESSVVLQKIKYTVSIGAVSVIPEANTTMNILYQLSDTAMYQAKAKGRNNVQCVDYED